MSCAPHADKVPRPAWRPRAPPEPASPAPVADRFSDNAAGPQAAEGSFGVFRPKPAEDCSGLQDWEKGGVGVHRASFPA